KRVTSRLMKSVVPVVLLLLSGCSGQPQAQVYNPGVGGGGPAPDLGSNDPLYYPSTCTSGNNWTLGDRGSAEMHPGGACIDCHPTSLDAPQIPIGGTVFPTGHEPTDCYGFDGLSNVATVVITDAAGKVYKARANQSGNFYVNEKFTVAFPITAKVVLPDGR